MWAFLHNPVPFFHNFRKFARMLEKLYDLEALARRLEPSPAERNQWNDLAAASADAFLNDLPTAPAYQASSEKDRSLLSLGIPEDGRPMEILLQAIADYVNRPGINPASGFHFGYVPGGGVFPTALGDYLAAVANRYSGIFFASPGAVRIENQLIRWMAGLAGYPETALGNLTSGGSLANLIAICTARDSHRIQPGNVQQAVIYLTRQVHHCVQKALRIAGLESALIRYVSMDDRFRMDPVRLWETVARDRAEGLHPFLVVGSAGTTDTGAIDPLNDIADIAAEYGLWYHVDAAYGGFFLLVDELRRRFRGIERSDSVAIDPHKGLFLAYGSGAVLIKDVQAQYRTHYYQANYMQDALPSDEELSPADLSPELTKHFRGLRMWLPLQLYGLAPFRAALEEKVLLCRYFYTRIQELGFEVGPEPELSIMIFRYRPGSGDANAFNQRLLEKVRADGRVFLSSTTLDGVFWIRMAVMSFRSHRYEVDTCLEVLQESLKTLKEQ